MWIIAFITDAASIQAILAHMGEPTRPPPLAPARDPPAWAGDTDTGKVIDSEGEPAGIDPLAQPEPESIFDQRISWLKADRCADAGGLPSAGAAPGSGARKRALTPPTGPGSPGPASYSAQDRPLKERLI
jgi:hypothetical protein